MDNIGLEFGSERLQVDLSLIHEVPSVELFACNELFLDLTQMGLNAKNW